MYFPLLSLSPSLPYYPYPAHTHLDADWVMAHSEGKRLYSLSAMARDIGLGGCMLYIAMFTVIKEMCMFRNNYEVSKRISKQSGSPGIFCFVFKTLYYFKKKSERKKKT